MRGLIIHRLICRSRLWNVFFLSRRPVSESNLHYLVSRLEALSDAVFGFAITLLVVSLEVPATYDELVAMMRGFVAYPARLDVDETIFSNG